MGTKICPSCGGTDIAGGLTGSWECADCGYSGTLFPEKGDDEEVEERVIKKVQKRGKKK